VEQPLTKIEAERVIRRIAGLVNGFTPRGHCRKRMAQRGFDDLDLVRILKNAELVRPAERRGGEWRYCVRERPGNAPPERQDVYVVVVIESDVHLFGQTVYRRT